MQDGQGSTRALTSNTGAVTDTYSYTAFGEAFNSSGTTVNPYRYTGQQFDSLTSLYSLRARYYNLALGRFWSQDTYPVNFNNPVELNRYVYAANSPINAMDPSGHFAEYTGTHSPARQNAPWLFKIGVGVLGVLAVIVAVGVLWEVVDVPRVLPKLRSLERIKAEEQWKEYCRLNPVPQCKTKPQPTQIGTKVPPIVSTPTKGPTRRLYHATTVDKVLSILSGINLTIGKESPDFGQGFYTTASFTDAVGIATRWKGGTGAIVVFDVPIAELNSLNHLVFTSADSSWDNFVLFNRSVTGLHHNYDWVEGPVAKSWNLATRTVVPFEYPAYHQLSIHTSAAAQLFQRSITEILDYGDPNVNP